MMTRPVPLATIDFSTCWVTASVPNTLTSNRRRTRSIGTSAIGPVWPAPALLISTSMSQAGDLGDVVAGDVDPLDGQLRVPRPAATSAWASVSVVAMTW